MEKCSEDVAVTMTNDFKSRLFPARPIFEEKSSKQVSELHLKNQVNDVDIMMTHTNI